jgi:hypothetical protein
MSNQKRSTRRLGIPRGLPAELRRALAEELQRMGSTYREIAHAASPPLTPDQVLTMARAWNSLTPSQHASWHDAARKENMRGAYPPSRN